MWINFPSSKPGLHILNYCVAVFTHAFIQLIYGYNDTGIGYLLPTGGVFAAVVVTLLRCVYNNDPLSSRNIVLD